MTHIKGISASKGIAIAQAYKLTPPDLSFEKNKATDPQMELNKLLNGLEASIREIEHIKIRMKQELDQDHANIFSAQVLLLKDPNFIEPVKKLIKNNNIKAEEAFRRTADAFIKLFHSMENKYMRERVADIQDITDRVLSHLLGVHYPCLESLNKEVIIIATELTPSNTALLNKQYVKGFSTEIGGPTSHSAIIARSLDIPALVGTKGIIHKIAHGDLIIIDSDKEIIINNPSKMELATYRKKDAANKERKRTIVRNGQKIVVTKDEQQITIGGNIGSPKEVELVLANGAHKIGLYRTEFLYIGKQSLPTEDEQYEAYKSVLQKMGERPVVIRTVDIGGDKQLEPTHLQMQGLSALGSRGIRFCLQNEQLFRTHLRALLRASVHGHLKIMFPMITTVEEFKQAKTILLNVAKDLRIDGIQVSDDIEVGMMIEVPSAALIARQFAKVADFLSIGTNDLIQYTFAVDRMNEDVSHLYQPYHPAILQLIDTVVQAAKLEGKSVSVCGEMAGDPFALPILLSLGVNVVSMSASSITEARAKLCDLSKSELAIFREDILSLSTQDEVIKYMEEKLSFLKV